MTRNKMLEKLNELRSAYYEEVGKHRAALDFDFRDADYQRVLGGLEALEVAISEVSK